jgi:hypothetical protein
VVAQERAAQRDPTATSVRGPKHVIKRGKTPVRTPDQARVLIDSIDTSTATSPSAYLDAQRELRNEFHRSKGFPAVGTAARRPSRRPASIDDGRSFR